MQIFNIKFKPEPCTVSPFSSILPENHFRYALKGLRLCLTESADFRSNKFFWLMSFPKQCSSVYFPSNICKLLNTVTIPPKPSLTAKITPSSSVARSTKTSFGQRFRIHPREVFFHQLNIIFCAF